MHTRLTYANVMATLAVFLGLGGSAMAADHYLITSKDQIAPSVRASLKGHAGKTGKAGKTGRAGVTGAIGPKGDAGDPGATGTPGPGGAQGPAGPTGPGQLITGRTAAVTSFQATTGPFGSLSVAATSDLDGTSDSGPLVLTGPAVISVTSNIELRTVGAGGLDYSCGLVVTRNGTYVTGQSSYGHTDGSNSMDPMSLALARKVTAGSYDIYVDCSSGATARVTSTVLVYAA